MTELKRFLIGTAVENASGTQTWYVDATSGEAALEAHKRGESLFYSEEVEVTALGEPYRAGVTALDDGPDNAIDYVQVTTLAALLLQALEIDRHDICDWPETSMKAVQNLRTKLRSLL